MPAVARAGAPDNPRTIENADRFAQNIVPVIQSIRTNGITILRGIASALNARGVRTARGGRWQAVQVGAVLARAGRITLGA